MLELNLEPCRPPIWANSGHLQTVLGHLLPSQLLPDLGRRVEVPLPDGDRLVGFLLKGNTDVVVYLFHGLAGSIDSDYIHRTARLAQARGHTVFMMNHRGCGAGSGVAKGAYHSGRAEDLAAAIALGKSMFPKHTHLAIGFSLSGNALLLLVSGHRGNTLPDLAISVNAPIDLHSVARSLGRGFNRIYDLRFYLQCRKDVLATCRAYQQKEIPLPRVSTLYAFDNLYTAPVSGFKNREDYYSTCSTVDLLADIKTPTVIITAEDDPFVSGESYKRAKISPSVHLHIEKNGGHMGYLTKEKTPLGTRRWQDYALDRAMAALLASRR